MDKKNIKKLTYILSAILIVILFFLPADYSTD